MTEDEARNKWCPFARVIHYHDNDLSGMSAAAGNRGCLGQAKPEALCIASDCAVWVEESAPPITRHTKGHCGLVK